MRTLLYEYRQTRRELRKDLNEICNSFEEILKPLRAAKDKIKIKELEIKLSLIKKDYNFMISNVEYVIDWLEHGREPGKMRGADKTKVYLKDPQVIDSSIRYSPLVNPDESSRELESEEKEMLEDALCTLTEREKEVFYLIKVEGLTFEYTSELLNIGKSTAQTHYKRALSKIECRKNGSLFLVV